MSSSEAKKDFPDKDQRLAVANSMFKKKSKKESMFCKVQNKEVTSDDKIVGGYIATTHLDSGYFDDDKGTYIRDKISKETLQSWANEINKGNPRSNKVSVNHERMPHVTGVGVKGSARVEQLEDGEYALYVDSLIDKTKDTFEDVDYRLDKGLLDSFSIEFTTKDPTTSEYYENAAIEEETGSGIIRTLMPGTILEGWTLASQPMNEKAVRTKENKIGNGSLLTTEDESHRHTWVKGNRNTSVNNGHRHEIDIDNQVDTTEAIGNHSHRLLFTPWEDYIRPWVIVEKDKESNLKKQEEKTMNLKEEETKPEEEAKVEESAPAEEAPKEEAATEEAAPAEEPAKEEPAKEEAVDEKEEFRRWKEYKEKEARRTEMKELIKEAQKELKTVQVETKVQANTEKDVVETKEIQEYKTIFAKDSKIDVNEQLKIAARVAEEKGMISGDGVKKADRSSMARKHFSTNGTQMEFKALGITTNQNTDTDYLLSAAELSDVFDPVIFNMLNQKTVTWNLLPKDDYSQKGNNQVQFTGKTAANTTAQAYTGDAVNTGNVTRLKYMTKFKKYQVGVEVSGDMIAAARGGPIGDVFAKEVADSTDDLMSVMNQALFAEVGLETAAGVIGFEYITDSAGNTSLYNLTRSTTNLLAPAAAGDTYINGSSADITIANLRQAKRQPIEEGADLNNLIWITSPIQADKFRGIFDAAQRLVPTSSRFGFEGRPEMDGIPIFEDKDCNDDDWFLIDLETHHIAIWVPPTLEMLGKDADSQKGFIKTYWCTYNRAPRRMVQIYGNSTS